MCHRCDCKKKCSNHEQNKPAVNIYHFGDSLTAPGNQLFEPSPGPETAMNSQSVVPPGLPVFQTRYNSEGIN